MSETETVEQATTEEKAPKAPRRGIGTVVMEALRAGRSNEEALAAAKAEFPDANTTMASVNWYRNKLRQDGEDIPTARSLKASDREKATEEKRQAKEAEKEAKKAAREAAKAARKAAKKKTTTDSSEAIAEADQAETAGAGAEDGFLS